jgi:hypothetical protein
MQGVVVSLKVGDKVWVVILNSYMMFEADST